MLFDPRQRSKACFIRRALAPGGGPKSLGFDGRYTPAHERFEIAWVMPMLSLVVPRLKKARHSFKSYSKLFNSGDGAFLRKLREVYAVRPSNETLAAALAAWRDMRLPETGPENEAANEATNIHWRLFLRDILNFEKLLETLTKKLGARAAMREALFAPSTKGELH
jgi:hypothetical protein